jgi:hypothetical protein
MGGFLGRGALLMGGPSSNAPTRVAPKLYITFPGNVTQTGVAR